MAATYQTPGVYIEEMPSGSMPIQGVGTAVAAFVGFTQTYVPEHGDPADPDGMKPQLVTSWPQYERIYGGFVKGALLPYAVRGFFDNGGTKCFVVRVPGEGASAAQQVELPAASAAGLSSLTVTAADPADTSRIEVEVVAPPPPAEGQEPTDEFTFRIYVDGAPREEIAGVSFSKGARTIEKTMNDVSTVVKVALSPVGGIPPAERAPAPGRYALAQMAPATSDPAELEGSVTRRTGYQGLEIADSVTMVAVPDLLTVTTRADGSLDEAQYLAFQGALADWCSASGKRMAILDPPPGLGAMQALEWRHRLGKDTAFATAYYPNVQVPNRAATSPTDPRFIVVPPCGHVAGVWARTDGSRGVWKAPANEELRGISGLETQITDGEQGELNPFGVNCIRSFGANGTRIWGARTLSQTDQSWRYINVRRLFNFIEESIRQGTQWAVFEPNDRDLWERVKRNIRAFLRGLWMQGALVGSTAEQAFYVLCDETNNPPSSVIVEIGIAPVKPAEFVVFRISQWQGGADTSE
jgi:phage tail sheath protein FI